MTCVANPYQEMLFLAITDQLVLQRDNTNACVMLMIVIVLLEARIHPAPMTRVNATESH
jgi:hypothetical protein